MRDGLSFADDGCMADYYDPYPDYYEALPEPTYREPDDDTKRGFGHRALLEQTELWIDKQGQTHRVADIDSQYAGNIVRFLERRAHYLKWCADLAVIHETSGPSGPHGDMAMDLVDRELDALFETHPLRWLHDQPLVKALRERAAA